MTESTESVHLPARMRAAIVAHARHSWPRECCGVLLGADGRFAELRRMVNIYPGEDFYEIDPGELYALYLECEGRGVEIAGIYHSHPISVAYPSVRDVEYAGWPDAVYLICSLEQPADPVIRAFRIVDGLISELGLTAAG